MLLEYFKNFFNKEKILADEKDHKQHEIIFNLALSNGTRFFLISQAIFAIYLITNLTDNKLYFLLIIPVSIIILDAVYVSYYRH